MTITVSFANYTSKENMTMYAEFEMNVHKLERFKQVVKELADINKNNKKIPYIENYNPLVAYDLIKYFKSCYFEPTFLKYYWGNIVFNPDIKFTDGLLENEDAVDKMCLIVE